MSIHSSILLFVGLVPIHLMGCAGTAKPGDTDTDTDTDTAQSASLSPDFVDSLTESGGCMDFTVWVRNAEDTLVVVAQGEGAAHAAHQAGETVETGGTIEPGADGWVLQSVQVWQGEHVSQGLCTDDIDQVPDIQRTWEGEYGSYTMTATPTGTAEQGSAPTHVVLLLQDVELSDPTELGLPVVMEGLTIETQVGHPAGG